MSGHEGVVAPTLDTSGLSSRREDFLELQRELEAEVVQGAEFSRIAQDAIQNAVERPFTGSHYQQELDRLQSPTDELVGAEKTSLVATTSRPGAVPVEQVEPDQQAQLESRVRELYLELTNYQVAWKIAQRMQQDTTQLLRGN